MIITFDKDIFDVPEISQYEDVRHNKEFHCECGYSNLLHNYNAIIIGYCRTNVGHMPIFECPKCFEKYRHHINTIGRYNLDMFKDELGLILHLQKYKNYENIK